MTSYAHFSNPYDSLAQQLPVTAAGLVTTPAAILSDAPHSAAIAAPGTGTAGSTGTPCCDTGRPVATDPVTGQVICSCQYDSGRLPVNTCAPRIPAVSAASPLAYGASTGSPLAYGASTGSPLTYGAAAYPSTEHNPYPSIGVDSAAYFSQFASPYSLKDAAIAGDMGVYGSIAGAPAYGYSPYEAPMYAAYTNPYELAARRKNATRESTNTLKAWLNEHKKNPYPTKGEKIMLAIITKMTLTQVSTWFANARRRLKKENKMTWEPRNRTDDDDDGDDDLSDKDEKLSEKDCKIGEPTYSSSTLSSSLPTKPVSRLAEDDGEEKPRIWSLAETASTTDPARLAGIQANWSSTAPVGQGLSPSLSLHSLYPHPQLLPSCTAATANITSSGDKHHFSSADHHTRQLSHQPASQYARLTPTCGSSSPPRSPAVSMRASSMLTGDTIINHATAPSLSPTATAPSLNPTGPKHFPSSTAVSIHGASAPFTASAPADRLTRLTTSEASFSPSAMTRLSATNIKPLVPSEPIPQAHASLSCTTGAPSTDSHLTAWSSYHQWKQHYASSAAVYGAAAAAVAASTPLPGHQLSTPTTLPALASSNALPHTVDQPRA